MIITKFYNIINEELDDILKSYSSTDEKLKQHKDIAQNKGYSLLVWFLKFYGQKDLYKSYVTDGNEDSSCDIIFSNKNAQDEDIFYVVQSKYINLSTNADNELVKRHKGKEVLINVENFPKIDKEEFGSTLNDFNTILSGARQLGQNQNFNRKYEDLKKHLESNGKVKFIFFTLATTNEDIQDAIIAFNKNYAPNITLEVIDNERIRRDYIEFRYKEIQTANPLEYTYNSEDGVIELPIERIKDSKRDIFEFDGRSKAFTFLLKPKTVYDLFRKYKFSLFFKNVRNPLHKSNYNPKIIETLLKKPDAFWYFNNGITAITKILPNIGIHAKKIELEGFQVINGAQTVYSVYSAYANATFSQRKTMDAYAKIAIRLIGSSDEEFNLQITRYTNLQNPMLDRDFWANDAIQQKLQDESFYTDLWYEKRRDEFQLTDAQKAKLGIKIISNEYFALAYVAFQMQKPAYATTRLDDIFISQKDDKNGLYEDVFDAENTNFEDMYAALILFWTVSDIMKKLEDTLDDGNDKFNYQKIVETSAPILALSRVVMEKYFAITRPNKSGKTMNISRYIFEISKTKNEKDWNEIKRIVLFSRDIIFNALDHEDDKKVQERFNKLTANNTFYNTIAQKVEGEKLDIEKIKSIALD